MGTRPTKAADNVYCAARVTAAKYNDKLRSRESAAELLGVSPSTLADYELGVTKIVPVDKVLLMADLYNAPELRNYYCRTVCPFGDEIPALEVTDLDRVTLKTLSALKKVADIRETLIDISSDGVIDDAERPALGEVLESLDTISRYAQELKLWAEKNLKEE